MYVYMPCGDGQWRPEEAGRSPGPGGCEWFYISAEKQTWVL